MVEASGHRSLLGAGFSQLLSSYREWGALNLGEEPPTRRGHNMPNSAHKTNSVWSTI